MNVLIAVVTMSSRSRSWRDRLVDRPLAQLRVPDEVPRPRGDEAGGDDRRPLSPGKSTSPAICSWTNRGYGLSVVERANHVIAIRPGVGAGLVLVVAVASRRSGRRRASAGPTARRSGARPATGRRLSPKRRLRGADPSRMRPLPQEWGAIQSNRSRPCESTSADPPGPTGRAPPSPTAPVRIDRSHSAPTSHPLLRAAQAYPPPGTPIRALAPPPAANHHQQHHESASRHAAGMIPPAAQRCLPPPRAVTLAGVNFSVNQLRRADMTNLLTRTPRPVIARRRDDRLPVPGRRPRPGPGQAPRRLRHQRRRPVLDASPRRAPRTAPKKFNVDVQVLMPKDAERPEADGRGPARPRHRRHRDQPDRRRRTRST